MLGRTIVALLVVGALAETRELLTRRLGGLKCDGDFTSLGVGSTCTSTWSKLVKGTHQLRPTEPSVGHAWVFAQMNNHFSSVKHSKNWFGKHQFPVVLGGDSFYLTDRHHHALAIQETGDDDIWALDITLFIQCDLRHLTNDEFWKEMQKRNYNLLIDRPRGAPFALPSRVEASALPTGFTSRAAFTDNMWRSLAGFASHVDDDASRCYAKPCVAFVDYEWSYVLNYATEVNSSLWPAGSDVSGFKQMFEAMTYQPSNGDAVDTDAWSKVAAAVLTLCHSPSLNGFQLPSSLPFPAKSLQGWSAVPVPDDPDCSYERCSRAVDLVV